MEQSKLKLTVPQKPIEDWNSKDFQCFNDLLDRIPEGIIDDILIIGNVCYGWKLPTQKITLHIIPKSLEFFGKVREFIGMNIDTDSSLNSFPNLSCCIVTDEMRDSHNLSKRGTYITDDTGIEIPAYSVINNEFIGKKAGDYLDYIPFFKTTLIDGKIKRICIAYNKKKIDDENPRYITDSKIPPKRFNKNPSRNKRRIKYQDGAYIRVSG